MAVVAALVLYVVLPNSLIIRPRWLVPLLEGALLVPLAIGRPYRHPHEAQRLRVLAVGLIALINVANVVSVGLLVHRLVAGTSAKGRTLVYSAAAIWLTNVIVFGLWYWELDRGGPGVRDTNHERHPDFQYPQMVSPEMAPAGWRPSFLDYMYVSFTNAAAFSPTDTMPLTATSKTLMTIESLVSLLTVVVVAARAVNILT
ncbi:MAG TPA: hypothetical protein VFP54_06070 [Acidimicrobiales bacterium]|nr:hypothetical protein [Acidimicrobiales bacterium]